MLTFWNKCDIIIFERSDIVRYLVSVSDEFYKRLKEEAEKAGMGISEYTRYCINRHWDYMYCVRKDGE